MPGIDDAAFTISFVSSSSYSYQVDYCQENGGKAFEPTKTTNDIVYKWKKEKYSLKYLWLGIRWSKKHSEFQYESNDTRISWANFDHKGEIVEKQHCKKARQQEHAN